MKNNSLYKIIEKNSDLDFDRTKVSQYVLQLKFCQCEHKRQKIKFLLFKSLSKLYIKAVNNFFKLVESFPPEKVIHTNEDISAQCYIIMDKCVENTKVANIKSFYFYLNTSLNRGIYRLFEKNYKKHYSVVSNSSDNDITMLNRKHNHHFDMSEIDLRGFSDIELEIIKFKISGEKLKVFLKEKGITDLEFSIMFETVKLKLIKLYDYKPDNNKANI